MNAILINCLLRFFVWWLLPKLPTSWKDSEQVQVFFVALIRSTTANELTKLTKIPLDDKTRLALATLAENSVFWGIAWSMLNSGIDETKQRETIRERIRNRISDIRGRFFGVPESLLLDDSVETDIEKLVTMLNAAKVLFGGA